VKNNLSAYITAITLFVAPAIPSQLLAQQPRYKLVDMGTFGGPQGYLSEESQILNNQGTVAGFLDTSTTDPNFPNFSNCFNPDCFFSHAFQWQHGVLTDLGALPGGGTSLVSWISDNGLIAGLSENGVTDPLTGTAEGRAVLWSNGTIINLGALPGGNESYTNAVNSAGQLIGASSNDIPDPFSLYGWGTETRAVLWRNGTMQDLGTLGGPDAAALNLNERGQISGYSYTNSTPNSSTGVPTAEPFLWERGEMKSLGGLGGTYGYTIALNNSGQAAGISNLVGDLAFHPFLWSNGTLTDLGTFGGTMGNPNYMNDAGEVVGQANYPGDVIHHAFLWKDGVLRDLGTLDKCSTAYGINSKDQVVGASGDCGIGVHAFLWEKGKMMDLTKLIPPGVELVEAIGINDRGEIACEGRITGPSGADSGAITGVQHAFLLIPESGENTQTTTGATQDSSPSTGTAPLSREPGGRRRYQIPGPGTGPTN
jgi:probable HAF family extracellular repeat protein